jgi:hypothetical protein
VAQNTANADAVLKNYYLGPIREQLNQKAVLMFAADDDGEPRSSKGETFSFRGLSRESERIEYAGKLWVIPAHKSRNEGVGAIDEGGPIPTAGQQGYEDLTDVLRHNLGSIEITRYAIRLSSRKPGRSSASLSRRLRAWSRTSERTSTARATATRLVPSLQLPLMVLTR